MDDKLVILFDDKKISHNDVEDEDLIFEEIESIQKSPTSIIENFSPIIITDEEQFMIPVDILYLGSNDISRFISTNLSKIMKYSRILEIWIIYNNVTHFWEKIKKPEATLSTFLQKSINNTKAIITLGL